MTAFAVTVVPEQTIVGTVVVKQGPAGPPGAGGSYLLHTQSVAATIWTVNHNFGFKPVVSVLSVGGIQLLAEVVHISSNQVQIIFDGATAGQAIFS